MAKAHIGIIGSGNMGRALGTRFADLGYSVMFGARQAEAAAEIATAIGRETLGGTIEAAAQHGEILIWTIRELDPAKVFKDPRRVDGKIIVDINNRDFAREVIGGAWFAASIAEKRQEYLPRAKVIKAFNTIAMESFDISPDELRESGAQTFLAGDNVDAKLKVAQLARDLGFEPIDLGSGNAAFRAAEALGDVIRLIMASPKRGPGAHFRVIELPEPSLGQIGTRQNSNYR